METKNAFANLVAARYSCRDYSSTPVSDADIAYLLEQVRLAPSACNRQPWRIMVIGPDDEAGRHAIAEAYNREWIRTAPCYIVMCGVADEAWVRPDDGHNHMDVDVSIATEHLCLAAAAIGLGSCWVCNFNPALLRRGLALDPSLTPVAIVPIGHPAGGFDTPEKKRKPLADIIISR